MWNKWMETLDGSRDKFRVNSRKSTKCFNVHTIRNPHEITRQLMLEKSEKNSNIDNLLNV